MNLFRAILNPRSPNYAAWQTIFGNNTVPLKSAHPIKADLGEEKDIEAYLLNLDAMPLKDKARLLGALAQRFGVPIFEVDDAIKKSGMPIRAADVIVSFDMRAFV